MKNLGKIENEFPHIYAASFCNNDVFLKEYFTIEEVQTVIKKLRNGKAGGLDGCGPEHYKYGGYLLMKVLCVIFNTIVCTKVVPSNFLCSLDVSVFKGSTKNHHDRDNYRKISLVSIMSKIFEMLLSNRTKVWFEPCLLGQLQGASHKHCSSMDVSLIVQESIAYMRDEDSDVYVAVLDTRKAFDTVWHYGLFWKLYQKGLNAKLWRILWMWYRSSQGVVVISNVSSKVYNVLQGVCQGGVLSLSLYQVYIVDLQCSYTAKEQWMWDIP